MPTPKKDTTSRPAREPETDDEAAERPFTTQFREKLPESEEELRADE